MRTTAKSSHSKTESNISQTSTQYTRSKIRSNNMKLNPSNENKTSYPSSKTPAEGDGQKKKFMRNIATAR